MWLRAKSYIEKNHPLIIAVTGSYGKSLTKEAIALALKDSRRVRVSHKSYNTPVGVALSILGVQAAQSRLGWFGLLVGSKKREIGEAEPEIIVLEMGADRPGDIDWLVGQVPVKIGVVTSVGSTHLRYFVNKDMVAHEKLSLPISLQSGGTAILNADDPLVLEMKDHIKAPAVLYGEAADSDVRLSRSQSLGGRGYVVEISVEGAKYEIHLRHLIAKHQIYSVLAAIAVAKAMGVTISQATNNLSDLRPMAGRLRVLAGINSSLIIDDSYNAAPEAVMGALQALKNFPGGRKIAILGDMLDLGGESHKWHQAVGDTLSGFAEIFVGVGEGMKQAQARALLAGGIDTHHFAGSADAGKWIAGYIRPDDVILVKGSREMKMEKVVARLLANPKADKDKLVH